MSWFEIKKGDLFKTVDSRGGNAFGIALSDSQALIISGQGGRQGYQRWRSPIPHEATPISGADHIPFEIKLTLDAVGDVIQWLPQ